PLGIRALTGRARHARLTVAVTPCAAAPFAALVSHRRRDLRLAIRTHPPARIERAPTAATRLLELPHAGRAPEEVGLDLASAVPAGSVFEQREPLLGGPDLEVALVRVLEVLRGADDRVDDRADERK